ncbi:MAG: potassium channel family protein [Actinomycetota bacterium]|nr:potassium channel family protein [Actinomycetota bacterium]
MALLAGLNGLLLIAIILWDAFETIILPRRVTRRVRLARLFYRYSWKPWLTRAQRMRGPSRESFLSLYGPLSLLLLIIIWAVGLIIGFALLQWALGSALVVQTGEAGFGTDLYMSGTTFFTLGLGDVTPRTSAARVVTVIEAGTGFAFLALVIAYLPVLYQAFSRREVNISLLDARAGSPPTAVGLLSRHDQGRERETLGQFLHDWERWSAELLESHISYPVLAYFRSQHDNQSWLAALTMILDVCALVLVGIDDIPAGQAQLTFALARHAAVDLSQIFGVLPYEPKPERLSLDGLARLRAILLETGVWLHEGSAADQKLRELRQLYEPYVQALSDRLLLTLPPWIPASDAPDDWETSVWESTGTPLSRNVEEEDGRR